MPTGLFILLSCQLLGEGLRALLHLPVPGPVIGMFMLAAALVARRRSPAPDGPGSDHPGPAARDLSLERTANTLIRHMGLLFIPAGVGIVSEAALLRTAWLPLAAGLVGSTVLSLIATGAVMHRITRLTERRSLARTAAGSRAGR